MKNAIQFTDREVSQALLDFAIRQGLMPRGTYDLSIEFRQEITTMTYEPVGAVQGGDHVALG